MKKEIKKEIKNIWLVLKHRQSASKLAVIYAVCETRQQARKAKAHILLEKHIDDLYKLVCECCIESDLEKDDISIYKISSKSLNFSGLMP